MCESSLVSFAVYRQHVCYIYREEFRKRDGFLYTHQEEINLSPRIRVLYARVHIYT